MNINKIQNNSIHPSFRGPGGKSPNLSDSIAEYVNNFDEIEKTCARLGKDASADSARKRLLNGNPLDGDKMLVERQLELINKASSDLKTAGSNLKNANPSKDQIPNVIKKLFRRVAKMFSETGEKSNNTAKSLAYILAAGNVMKEIIGGVMYTIQAYTNEDLPEDKRKFVAVYDAAVSVVSATCSAIFGFGAISFQDNFIKKRMLGKAAKEPGHSKYGTAFAGLSFAIPLVLQTIIGKRIVAPAVATPTAGKLKEKLMAREEAKKQAVLEKNKNEEVVTENKLASKDLKFTSRGFIDLQALVEEEKALKNTEVDGEKKLARA